MGRLIGWVMIGAALSLGACSSSSDNPDTSASDRIAGLWDATSRSAGSSEDIYYLEIFADGSAVGYDYQQDELDAGDNCYIIDRNRTLTSLGGDLYRIEVAGPTGQTSTRTITRTGNVLTMSFTDELDENRNGNLTETLTYNFPLLTGVDPEFNECE